MQPHTVFHLTHRDPDEAADALRNVRNLLEDETIDATVRIVANGAGVTHLLSSAETSETVSRLLAAGVSIAACRNTIARARYGAEELVEGIEVVSSGMAELTRNQQEGYAYIRP